jgi:nicotinate-nucleotide adenylyltransferase
VVLAGEHASEVQAPVVALYGGSFDPPHLGHRGALELLSDNPDIDRVLMIPVFEHAFEKRLAPFFHRVAMCQLAAKDLGKVEVSQVEAAFDAPSYTLYTLRHLRTRHPDWRMRLVVGSDVLSDTEQWLSFEEVRKLAPLLPLGRRGYPHPDAPEAILPEVSSSQVRRLLTDANAPRVGQTRQRLLQHLQSQVLDYIDKHRLYCPPSD